ncbi:MAG: hypothetical protein MI861_10595, partial [Pirellulales bacterium]|nr:hypothetical protein [Pirellulales bacterium]
CSGGGAFELVAGGRLQLGLGVQFSATGGDGAYGTPGAGGTGGNSQLGGAGGGTGRPATEKNAGSNGLSGLEAGAAGAGGDGSLGGDGGIGVPGGQTGGTGGTGGDGQPGGVGGAGGAGGAGAGGAGGSIKLFGSVLDAASDVIVDVSGGRDASGNESGAGGRVIIGGNTDLEFDLSNRLTSVGGQPAYTNQIGDGDASAEYFTIRDDNPYVFDANLDSLQTPNIGGLIGGAEQFGFISGIDAQTLGADFNLASAIDFDISVAGNVFNNAPTDAIAAIYRLDLGAEQVFHLDLDGDGDTTDEDFTGYDMLLFANLTDLNLAAPRIGIHLGQSLSDVTVPLGFQGLGNETPVELTALNAGTVWATLIPEGDVTVNASIGGTTLADGVQLTAGYLDNFSGVIDPDQVEFITAGRPNLDEISSTGVEVDFQNISEIGDS